MSTPISRNNKLQGLDLYAPRHARERSLFDDQAASAEASRQQAKQQPEREQTQTGEPQKEQPQTGQSQAEQQEGEQFDSEQAAILDDADRRNEADETELLDWVDQAIRAVIELEHATGGSKAPRVADTPSPSVAPAQSEGDEVPPPSPGLRRQDRGAGRAAPPRPPRRPSLDPEIVPEPPAAVQRNSFLPLFMRLSLVTVFAAIVAYGLTALASLQPSTPPLKGAGDRVAGIAPQSPQVQPDTQPPSRLVVADRQAFANEPLSPAVNVADARQNESLVFDGLAQGTTLSAGASASPSSWQLPSDKLRGLYLYAPKDFVGVMNATVDLLGADRRVLDSRSMQLKWIAKEPKPVSPPAPVVPPSLITASAEATAGGPIGAANPVVPAIESVDPGEAAMLMQRGRNSLGTGDISAARVAFRRLADAGIADAALALANTYDPDYLVAHNVVGVQGDRAEARALYQRAKELGSTEAGRILARMAAQ